MDTDYGAASYVLGAINIYKESWDKFRESGTLYNSKGYLMMHEYGHYLQKEIGGTVWYYLYVVPASLHSNLTNDMVGHSKHWAEVQASTLAYYFFGLPNGFLGKREANVVDKRYYSEENLSKIYNQFINHPDYKP